MDFRTKRSFARRGIFRRLAHAGRARSAAVSEPDILLLDEPTNYLDLEGTLWLQDHLAKYPRTMIVIISHDRDLLDNAVDSILHLDQSKLSFYRGGYTQFRTPAARAADARSQAGEETGRPSQASDGVCRTVSRQGHQGTAGRSPG